MIDRDGDIEGDEANRWQLIATMTPMPTATIIWIRFNNLLAYLTSYKPDFDFSEFNGLGSQRQKKNNHHFRKIRPTLEYTKVSFRAFVYKTAARIAERKNTGEKPICRLSAYEANACNSVG